MEWGKEGWSMSFPLDLYPTLQHWAPVIGEIGAGLTGLAAFIGGGVIVFRYEANQRDAIRLRNEQRRISYRNLNINAQHVLTQPASARAMAASPAGGQPITSRPSQFLIFRMDVENIGDGPVDVWACLVAARELNAGDHRQSWGGNVEWTDLDPYYFDTTNPAWEHLAGISNTRHVVYSQDDYLQLDPKESDTLTRIDRIDPVTRDLTLVYRAFLVGRGYGKENHAEPDRDTLAWQRLQQAMFNLSGPSFRILFGMHDPLALVADRDGFQCFALYHAAFVDDERDDIGWTRIDHLNGELEGRWGSEHTAQEARALCEQVLAPCKERWRRHWLAIQQAYAQCKRLPAGFTDLMASDWRPQVGGDALPGLDLTRMTARQAFAKLPNYLKWNPQQPDSLPVWEKFIVVTLKPGDSMSEPQAVMASALRGIGAH
jgi:hypothetical protein